MEAILYRLDKFEGPLSLLLHLIDKEKIDIYDIPIADITEQYLDYVSKMREEDLEVVSDFLVMAATLLEIKSRMLLPREVAEDGEEIDPRAELVSRLLEYKKYRYMARLMGVMDEGVQEKFYRETHIPKEVEQYSPPIDLEELLASVNIFTLQDLLTDIIRRREDTVDQLRSKFSVIKREKISLQSRIMDVLEYARRHNDFSFHKILRNKEDKTEVVVSFLAILELMKMGKITIEQAHPFSDMDIHTVDMDDIDLDLSHIIDE